LREAKSLLETTMPTDSSARRQFSLNSSSVESTSLTMERFTPERLKLLQDLEASLNGSRRALLALDLAAIEQGTREQVGLVLEMQRLCERTLRSETAPQQEIAEEIRRSEEAVLQAARVQAALLARAQRKLRILANMLAGPSLNYRCLFVKLNAPATVVYDTQGGV